MFVWLKVLVFGLALVDMEAVDNETTTPGTALLSKVGTPSTTTTGPSFIPAHSTSHLPANISEQRGSTTTAALVPRWTSNSTEMPVTNTSQIPIASSINFITDGLKNASSIQSTTPSTGIPANTSQTSSDITTASIVTTSIQKDCSSYDFSVENYTFDGHSISAVLAGEHLLRRVSCDPDHCRWNEEDQKLSGLQGCKHYQLQADFGECQRSKKIEVPPVGIILTAPIVTNTSVILQWNVSQECDATYLYCCYSDEQHKVQKQSTDPRFKIEHLFPNKNYSCKSEIRDQGNRSLANNTIHITTDFGEPGKPENLTPLPCSRNITISWKEPKNQENGPIHGYMVSISDPSPGKPLDVSLNTSHTWDNLKPFSNYSVAVWAYTWNKQGCVHGNKSAGTIQTKPDKPTKPQNEEAILREKNNEIRVMCSQPKETNGPQKRYIIEWNGEMRDNDSCHFDLTLSFLTTYNFKITFNNGMYNSEPVFAEISTKYDSDALIIFLAFLIIVTTLALIIVLYKIYDLKKEKSRNADETVMLVVPDDEKQLMHIDPIPAELLWETYKRKIADEGRLFLDEFQSIPRVFSKFSIKDARRSYNQNKNRYVDILPYDYNRVELTSIINDPGSDYINASHIDGYKEPRKYIAAQGPKEETMDDFWRMIWEQKATIIVMVTRCEEGNRIKCAKYWPSLEEETASYGDIVVRISDCKVCPDYIIQKLHITNRREKTTARDVTHIQFTSWPDHGVPDDPHLLLKLRRRVNALSNFFSGPIVVHCSAGVGRTGTYIGIDAMLEGLETEGRMDIYGYVVKLRRQRCLMVQVETQYILMHQALVEYVQYGETEVSILELHNYLNNLKKCYPVTEPSLLEAEFQRLPSYKNWQTQRAGIREENKTRNRSSVIPYDYNRVLFKHEDEGKRESELDSNDSSDEESDCEVSDKYINASYITGYWLQNAMIAAEGPLQETVSDFWSMIYQRKVKVIVMLTQLKDDTQDLCAQYWVEGKQVYNNLIVELKETNCSSSYTIRLFNVTHVKRKETREVFHYQYLKWKAFGHPEPVQDLVDMIQSLKQKLPGPPITAAGNVYNKNVPLVVHCRDGSQQTGIFCALMNLLDSTETEGVIDVFQVVKSLRKARPGMVSTFEDYQFLYDAIAGVYPAQNGQLQKHASQEHKVNIHDNSEEREIANSATKDVCIPIQESENDVNSEEDSKATPDLKEAENSLNGPTNPVLTEIA